MNFMLIYIVFKVSYKDHNLWLKCLKSLLLLAYVNLANIFFSLQFVYPVLDTQRYTVVMLINQITIHFLFIAIIGFITISIPMQLYFFSLRKISVPLFSFKFNKIQSSVLNYGKAIVSAKSTCVCGGGWGSMF